MATASSKSVSKSATKDPGKPTRTGTGKAAKETSPPAKPTAPAKTAAKPSLKTTPKPTKPAEKSAKSTAPQTATARKATDQPTTKTMKPQAKTQAPAPAKAAAKTTGKKFTGMPSTDSELLAMAEADYMNDAQLAYFKAKLIAMRDEILENARETGEHLKENEVFADPNDRATVEEENLLEQRVRDRERKLLKKINASLARIEEGEYGYCLETGEPIGLPRLLARPTAELSIEAQEKHERMEKLYAD